MIPKRRIFIGGGWHMYLENIPSEAISSQILNGLQTYDILDNPRVGAEGLKYMQYIYLGRGKGNAYVFRGADRDSEGFLTLGSICIVNNPAHRRSRFRNEGYKLYIYDLGPETLLSFKSQKQICESCGVNVSKLSQYSVLDLAESLTEEEEPQELVLPLDDIKLTYKDGVTHLQASKYLNSDRYSIALSGVAQQILGISLSVVCNLYAQDAEDLLPTQ